MEQSEIELTLARFFPTDGVSDEISADEVGFMELVGAINKQWSQFPPPLKEKIKLIESNMCLRRPFCLYVFPLFTDEDLVDLLLDDLDLDDLDPD